MIHVHETVSISRSVDQIGECVEVLHARGEFNMFVELGVYFDDFQIVAVSFIAEFSFWFCCFVFYVKQSLKIKFVVYYVMTKMGAHE